MVVRATIRFDDDVFDAINDYRIERREEIRRIMSFNRAVNELIRKCAKLIQLKEVVE